MRVQDLYHNATDGILSHTLFLNREYQTSHLPYEKELSFYDAVKNGDVEKLREIMLPLRSEGLGRLSQDPLRNLKYHLIITIALITRFCMEGGLSLETAYTLSDVYIQQLDLCKSETEIDQLHKKAVFDYANRMKKTQSQSVVSRLVIKAMDYIYDHLHEKIALDNISNHVGISKSYLCDLFKKETGITVGQYVTERKIEAAENMLIYSDYTSVAISNYFVFSSHSHFITVFKTKTGMTPENYRKCNYRHHFKNK